ncbi:MAG: gamma-glutamylcyclotransferase family protein [Salibaculum sp.]|uniref:gamma-glutamylcyclotransferase family protein n=1 Tax=Salibaculum sp. TaxID=2855480 RepID=UPI0028703D45|nr:gamma-glutamylcyclotransferase family protein [Salibaculum sp.]MDR9483305.1 gamma-glutamylcyclotransferase family protein [Salibaculum sp.]
MSAATPHPAFFGYGSLVNLATHDYADPFPAKLRGWRRVWKHSSRRPVAFLSVEPAKGAEILGMLAHVPGGDWSALDRREQAYLRRDVTDRVIHDRPRRQTAVYEAARGHIGPPSTEHPILLSYLDVVVQGYLNLQGRDGAAHFFATTAGLDGPIVDDRAAPLYPRHQTLSRAERRLVDTALADIGARFIPARP